MRWRARSVAFPITFPTSHRVSLRLPSLETIAQMIEWRAFANRVGEAARGGEVMRSFPFWANTAHARTDFTACAHLINPPLHPHTNNNSTDTQSLATLCATATP